MTKIFRVLAMPAMALFLVPGSAWADHHVCVPVGQASAAARLLFPLAEIDIMTGAEADQLILEAEQRSDAVAPSDEVMVTVIDTKIRIMTFFKNGCLVTDGTGQELRGINE